MPCPQHSWQCHVSRGQDISCHIEWQLLWLTHFNVTIEVIVQQKSQYTLNIPLSINQEIKEMNFINLVVSRQMLKIILLRMGGLGRVALCWLSLLSLLKYFNQCMMNGRRRAGPALGGVPSNLADKCKMAKLFLIKLDYNTNEIWYVWILKTLRIYMNLNFLGVGS